MSSFLCGGGFDLDQVDDQPGMVTLIVSGRGASDAFRNEAGGHRYQRIPPNERKGRVHTSTVTVAILPIPEEHECQINDRDLEWKVCRGSGAGGQHRNVTNSAVSVTHLPSGLTVRCESERSQHQNKVSALALLRARLGGQAISEALDQRNQDRRGQLGSGQRGDKRRTVAIQRDQVHDHVTDKRMSAKQYLRGEIETLW